MRRLDGRDPPIGTVGKNPRRSYTMRLALATDSHSARSPRGMNRGAATLSLKAAGNTGRFRASRFGAVSANGLPRHQDKRAGLCAARRAADRRSSFGNTQCMERTAREAPGGLAVSPRLHEECLSMFRRAPAAALAVLLACVAATAGAQTPSPSPSGPKTPKPAIHALSGQGHNGGNRPRHVSSAACNRRSVSTTSSGGTMGPNGASTSQTLIAVPIGGGNVASATEQQRIAEACAHQRH
jgi:hypothetical protein